MRNKVTTMQRYHNNDELKNKIKIKAQLYTDIKNGDV